MLGKINGRVQRGSCHFPFFFSAFGSSFLLLPLTFSTDFPFLVSCFSYFFFSSTFLFSFSPFVLIGFFSSSISSFFFFLIFLFMSSGWTSYFFFQASKSSLYFSFSALNYSSIFNLTSGSISSHIFAI